MKSELIIDEKKYMILPFEEYKSLKVKASPNLNTKSRLSIDEAEAYSTQLINKWAKEKSQSNRK